MRRLNARASWLSALGTGLVAGVVGGIFAGAAVGVGCGVVGLLLPLIVVYRWQELRPATRSETSASASARTPDGH